MANLTCQLRSRVRGHIDGESVVVGKPIWRTAKRGQELIDQRLAELILEPVPSVVEMVEETVPEKPVLARLAGWPMNRFSRVERSWEGKTVVCMASGPSVTDQQVEVVRRGREQGRCRVIVVNTTFLKALWADVLYFADAKWWLWFTRGTEIPQEQQRAFRDFTGLKCTVWLSGNQVNDPKVHMLRIFGGAGALSLDPESLSTGSNSGHQAVNLAAHAGAARILLLGYDAKAGPSGKKHHHADHPDKSEAPYSAMHSRFPALAKELAAVGVEVINCSPGSALKCFPMRRIEDVLA